MRELAALFARAYITKQAGFDPSAILDQAKQLGGKAVDAAKENPTLTGAAAGGTAGFLSGHGLRQRLRRFLGGAAMGGAAGYGTGQLRSAVSGPGETPSPTGKYSFPGGAVDAGKLKSARQGEAFKTYAANPDQGLASYLNPVNAIGATAGGVAAGAYAAPATTVGAGVSAARAMGQRGNRMAPEMVGEGQLFGHGAAAMEKNLTHKNLAQTLSGMDASHRQNFAQRVAQATQNNEEFFHFLDKNGTQHRINTADAAQVARAGVKGMLNLGEKDRVPGAVRQEWNTGNAMANNREKVMSVLKNRKGGKPLPVTRAGTLTARPNYGRNLIPLLAGAGIDLTSYGLGARGPEANRRGALSKLQQEVAPKE